MCQSDNNRLSNKATETSSNALNTSWLYYGKLLLALIALNALNRLTTLRWLIPIKLVRIFHWLGMEKVSDWLGKITGLSARIITLFPTFPAIIELEKHGSSL